MTGVAVRTNWWVLVLLSLAQFMVILDVTVVNVALPQMAIDLSLDRAALTWVVTAYTLCFGGLMLLGGRLADTVGRRRVFLAGLVVFTIASLASGLAGSATALVVSRAAQGVGAALLSPAAMSILTTTFHGPERNRALGVWAAIAGAGAAVGVLLGGVFTAGPGWEWVFFINVPVGVLVAVLLPRLVPAGQSGQSMSGVDVPGALTVVLGVGALIYGLVRAGDTGWSGGSTPWFLAGGVALLALFVLVERRAARPLVPLSLLGRRPVVAGNLVMLAASALLLGNFFLNSQYLQHVLGLDALQTGLIFLPVALVIGLGTHLGVRVVSRFGGRPAVAAGFGLAAVGALLLAQVPASGNAVLAVLPGFLISGLGLGAAFVTATTTAMAHVGPHDAGTTSGLVNTGHELGATLGIAFVSTIAAQSLQGGGVTGFGAAFTATAVVAAVVAVGATLLVPAGRPPATDGPVFAH
ncbi:DHA2 family efflux MFS transporter permease subunit [Lentzea aerocolonigenes]|uniref:DHA2 family efflux MFS transporter permease subunit n=1 Tax=Lentzea aerocolonigenes TaxID=68170 RepID=UPI0004C43E1B|nr:DHA2 family efflux MFS transporter permease subunit [Lentzea aerocolonigenes]MCP2247345.1 drug resistance transporter, EmrB/QacA subfamily [Lentzea aerocolonigenes]